MSELSSSKRLLDSDPAACEVRAVFFEQRYDEQHRTVHRLEDALAEARATQMVMTKRAESLLLSYDAMRAERKEFGEADWGGVEYEIEKLRAALTPASEEA